MDVLGKQQLSQPLTQHHKIQTTQITALVLKPKIPSIATLPITATNVFTVGPKSSERIQTIMVPQAIISNPP